MDNVVKIILIAAAVVIVALIIKKGMDIYNSSEKMTSTAMGKVNGVQTELEESDFTQYDGLTITGNEVISAIKHFKKEKVCISVNNGSTTTQYIYNADLSEKAAAKISDAMDRGKLSTYINPNADFLGSLVTDESTGTITGVTFTKQ